MPTVMSLATKMNKRVYKQISEDEISRLINIQNLFYELNSSNVSETVSALQALDVIKNEERCKQFSRLILAFIFVHPRAISLFADVVSSFKSNEVFLNCMFNQIFHANFRLIEESNDHYLICILCHCMLRGVYQPEKIVSKLKEIFVTKRHFQTQHAYAFLYFAPEIEAVDIEFYKRYRLNALLMPSRHIIHSAISQLDQYKKDDWKKLKEIRSEVHCGDIILKIMLDDDIKAFRALAASVDFNIDQPFTLPPLSPFHYLEENPPLISVAAATAAVEIFKFLVGNNAKMDIVVPRFGSLAQNAVVGGNLEIIRLVEQYGGDFKGTLPTSVRYYHNDIFHWLHETKFTQEQDLIEISPTKSTVLSQATAVCNIYILDYCMERGITFVADNDAGFETTYFDNVCYMGYLDQAKMMIDYGKIDRQTGLCFYLAAKNGHHEIMDLIYEVYHFNPNSVYEERDALSMCLFNSHRTTFEKLLNLPDIEITLNFEDNLSIIIYGASQGDVEMMKMLREKVGNNYFNQKVQGQPIFFYSAILLQTEMLKYLLSLPEMQDLITIENCLAAAIISIGKRNFEILNVLPNKDQILSHMEITRYLNQFSTHYQMIVRGLIPDDYELDERENWPDPEFDDIVDIE